MAELEAMLGHRFRRPELLQQALTHSSFAHEGGDRVQPAISGARVAPGLRPPLYFYVCRGSAPGLGEGQQPLRPHGAPGRRT